MNENIFAFTECNQEHPSYPGFVSFNRNEAGDVVVTVREQPTIRDGAHVCANRSDAGPGRCIPGGENCNNYCNMAPEKGPMQPSPLPCTQVFEGKTVSFTVPKDSWSL